MERQYQIYYLDMIKTMVESHTYHVFPFEDRPPHYFRSKRRQTSVLSVPKTAICFLRPKKTSGSVLAFDFRNKSKLGETFDELYLEDESRVKELFFTDALNNFFLVKTLIGGRLEVG